MSRTSWKQLERDVGTAFGGMRNIGSGSMGRRDHHKYDTHHPTIFFEAKARNSYTPLKTALKAVRTLATKKENRIGVLVFPGIPYHGIADCGVVAVHIEDLPNLARHMDHLGRVDPRYVHAAVVPRLLRSSFDTLLDAEQIAHDEENMPIAVVPVRAPKAQGFILLCRPWQIMEIAKWHAAGGRWVAKASGGVHVPSAFEQTADNFITADIDKMYETLANYEHHWHPPVSRKDRVKRDGEAPKRRTWTKPAPTEDLSRAIGEAAATAPGVQADPCGGEVPANAVGEAQR